MDLLRKLFGGAGGASAAPKAAKGAAGDRGLYFYVKPFGCDEVIRVRIDPMNDLSESDDGSALFVRKVASGVKCFKRVELEVGFNASRQIIDTQVTGGELVEEAGWRAWIDGQGNG
ncbi:MAG: hypothetical protein SF162_19675 [bacterium]|nr:hypothetical protein [bacterium]